MHVALWSAGRLIAGAVALPLGITYVDDGPPIEPVAGLLPPPADDRLRVVVSGSVRPPFSDVVAGPSVVWSRRQGRPGPKPWPSCAGEPRRVPHAGGRYEWDSAAPVAVAQAQGLWCGRIDGSQLVWQQRRHLPAGPDHLSARVDRRYRRGDFPLFSWLNSGVPALSGELPSAARMSAASML